MIKGMFDLMMYYITSTIASLGDYMPLCIGGAALFLASYFVRKMLRGRI